MHTQLDIFGDPTGADGETVSHRWMPPLHPQPLAQPIAGQPAAIRNDADLAATAQNLYARARDVAHLYVERLAAPGGDTGHTLSDLQSELREIDSGLEQMVLALEQAKAA